MAAALLPVLPGKQLYGKYVIRFRSDALQGFKVAWLLWPDSENWPYDGEMDFPESGLNGTIAAYMHRQAGTSGADQDAYKTAATYTSWHTATIEWSPNAVNFILDDQLIGTSTARIPVTSMHWVIQTESCLPTCPSATTAGNLQIDWMAAYVLA
jgi:beta-glucanase (GH16 family)